MMSNELEKGGLVLTRYAGQGIGVIDMRTGDHIRIECISVMGSKAQFRIVANKEIYRILREELIERGVE